MRINKNRYKNMLDLRGGKNQKVSLKHRAALFFTKIFTGVAIVLAFAAVGFQIGVMHASTPPTQGIQLLKVQTVAPQAAVTTASK